MIKKIKISVLVLLATNINIRRVIPMMLLAIVSNSAVAAWEEIPPNTDVANIDLPKAYVNLPIIGYGENNVELRFLVDFSKPQKIAGKSFMSILSKAEYNCKKEQIRSLSRTYHSDNMGEGEVVYDGPTQPSWQPDQEKNLWKIACGATNEWVEVVVGDKGTIYANPTNIRKNGNKIKMWSLTDYKESQNLSFGLVMSEKTQWEYNCMEDQVRFVFGHFYSKNMGKGEVLYTEATVGNWMPIAPETAGSNLLGIACGERQTGPALPAF